ncbi:hypothetical protein LSAT2_002134 [Lamellibrachia satsuma]|nr:hypothetical protein LSAT2_002134 [Lamellibrachia satsuma]
MSYEAVLPYPRSFGSAFTVPNFSGIDYPEDYSYFHSVAPDSCCLPHPLAAPHPQVKVLVHNSAGRPVVDRDDELESAAQPQMLHSAAATKAVIQPTREGRLGQLTNLEKVGRNPQTTLGKSGKELRQSSSNGNLATKTPVKTGTGHSRAVEKPSKKSDCTKVDNKSLSKKCDTPDKNDDHKAKKDPQNSTNPKKKSDTISKQEKKQQEPAKTKPKKDAEVIKNKKEQEGTKTKKSSSDVTKTSKDQPEAKKPKKAAEPAKPKKGADIEKTKKAEAVKQRRDSAPKSPVQLKKSDKSAAKDDVACQRARSSDKVVKVTPGLKKKDVQLMRRSSPHGWRWQGEPKRKPVFSQVDQPPVMHDCYPSICHDDGDVIKVRDCVLVKSGPRKKDIPFVGKVAAFWQNPDNEMMMSVLWYYRPEHTETERLPQFIDSEIFASKHRDAVPVACIDDKCHVLTFNQYCRYRAEQCCAEQAQLSLTRHVPKLPEALSSDAALMPLLDADPETVFLCRRVYDIKLKRVLKNPQVQWRDTPRLSSSTAGSESALCVDTHLMNSGSILAPASKNLSP